MVLPFYAFLSATSPVLSALLNLWSLFLPRRASAVVVTTLGARVGYSLTLNPLVVCVSGSVSPLLLGGFLLHGAKIGKKSKWKISKGGS